MRPSDHEQYGLRLTELLPPALVLTAGLGTRLEPLTRTRAKPAVPVAGQPLITRLLAWLARRGVHDVVLNLHHKPETIARVVGHGERTGVRIRYSWEPTILGTAGGPRHALPLLGPQFFLINGDTLTDISLESLRVAHLRTGAKVTIAVATNPAPKRYGGALVDDNNWVRGFSDAGHGTAAHFVGVQLVDASVFTEIPDGETTNTIGGLYDTLIEQDSHAIHAHRVTASFYDVGTPRDYFSTSLAIAEVEGVESLPVGENSIIHPTASLTRTIVWDRVEVSKDCHLRDCVLADGARLPHGCTLDGQIVVVAPHQDPRPHERRLGDLLISPFDPPTGSRSTI